MNALLVLAAAATATAVWASLAPPPLLPTAAASASTEPGADRMQALAPVWCALAALAVLSFLEGPLAWAGAAGAAWGLWVLLRRSEPAATRRRRETLARELPSFVEMFGAALASGAPVALALQVVREALPGPVAEELAPVAARLSLGVDPVGVWERLARDTPALAPLARVMIRSQESGAAVTAGVLDLADGLASRARSEVEDRARSVGVRAAVPLGLCLLPAFLLLGIVPLVAAAVDGLGW